MDINIIVSNLILAVLAAVLGWLGTVVRRRFRPSQIGMGQQIAMAAVQAVEQIAKTVNFDSAAKKSHAMDYAKQFAEKEGLYLTDAQWDALIEAAVGQMSQWWKSLPAPVTEESK
jgi:hypothetical protein